MPCATADDCPSNATCCDGSNESCDGTRLPTGDGTNSGEFVVSGDGLTVTDETTGLVWQRDGSGTRAGCSGGRNLTCTWAEAKAYCASLTLAGVSGWRLPAVIELSTIVDFTRTSPAIDPTAFPTTPSEWFWTSSPYTAYSGYVEDVYFSAGYSGNDVVGLGQRVRCVRGSRCYPTNRFVLLDGGLVRDTLTKLVWQQQASAAAMTLADARTYCPPGFRLPTVKELISLMDLTVLYPPGPTIDPTAFPTTPSEWFWTSSPVAFSASVNAWGVTFENGGWSEDDLLTGSRVRCVR
jgi:hypothetical protein